MQRITGKDFRLVGNWEPIPELRQFGAELALALGMSETALRRCTDITDVLDLIDGSAHQTEDQAGQTSLL